MAKLAELHASITMSIKIKIFDPLIDYITSGPSVIMVVSGENSISRIRELMSYRFQKSKKGTIRGDYGVDVTVNVIHGSDSPESKRESNYFLNN